MGKELIGDKKDYNSEKKVNKELLPARWDESYWDEAVWDDDNDEESECKNMSSITCSKLKQIKEKLAKLGYKPYISVEKLKLTIEIPPHNIKNQPIPVNMSLKIGQSLLNSVPSITVYSTHIWILADAYVDATPNIDGSLNIFKNYLNFLGSTPPLSAMLKHYSGRMTLAIQHVFKPGEILTISFIPSATNDSDTKIIEHATIEVIEISFDFINLSRDKVYEIADILEK